MGVCDNLVRTGRQITQVNKAQNPHMHTINTHTHTRTQTHYGRRAAMCAQTTSHAFKRARWLCVFVQLVFGFISDGLHKCCLIITWHKWEGILLQMMPPYSGYLDSLINNFCFIHLYIYAPVNTKCNMLKYLVASVHLVIVYCARTFSLAM